MSVKNITGSIIIFLILALASLRFTETIAQAQAHGLFFIIFFMFMFWARKF